MVSVSAPANEPRYVLSSAKPHSRQTKRVSPRFPVTIPIVTPHAGQIGGRSSSSSRPRFVTRPG